MTSNLILVLGFVLAALASYWLITFTTNLAQATVELAASDEFQRSGTPIPGPLAELKDKAPFVTGMFIAVIPLLLFLELGIGYWAGSSIEKD
jgi:hypothetical protein